MNIHSTRLIRTSHLQFYRWLAIVCIGAFNVASSAAQSLLKQADPTAMETWVEQQMKRLDTPEKQLGQLIMPMIYEGKGSYDTPATRELIEKQVKRYHIGGVVFSRSTITEHANLSNYAQQLTYEEGLPPLLVGADAEWGLAMRMSDAVKYPRNRDIGKIVGPARDTLCYLYGLELAHECRLMGIHINFGPVVDIDSNKKNPVIGNRSFGSEPDMVARCGIYFSHGVEDGGVMSVAKHFPGHGDTDTDSHKTLPKLKFNKKQLEKRELIPFQSFINEGLGGIMTAHLNIPKLAEKANMPSSASHKIVTELLKGEMGFNGLVITDGLAMKGATNYPDICVKALLAGNDILLQPTPDEASWQSLLKALKDGTLPASLIEEKCKRVLCWKYALIIKPQPVLGLKSFPYPHIDTNGLVERVHSQTAEQLATTLTKMSGAQNSDGIDPTLQTAVAHIEYAPTENFIAEATAEVLPPVPALTLPTAAPHEVGMDGVKMAEISRLAQSVIADGAAPGCQVLVIRQGKIVYDQTFGTLGGSPEQNPYFDRPVTAETLYDLASVSKAVGTIPAMIMLMDENGMKFKDKAISWLPELKGTKYAKITLQDLLFHETGLQEGYTFYKMTDVPDEEFRNTEMLKKIVSLKPRRKQGQYLYSCLNFVLLRYIIERLSGERIDLYLQKRLPDFFGPWLCFNPLEQGVPLSAIAPTEQDNIVRNRFIHGTVHDETGDWALGIEGNSGLFGSAEALAPLLQMMLNDGALNGKQYLPKELCHQFTTLRSSHSRRGMGFDKPAKSSKESSPCASECSQQTWGHTGFTGTCFWVDPKEELVYIFLSNRICPTRDNKKLIRGDYRSNIQSAIYQSIKNK